MAYDSTDPRAEFCRTLWEIVEPCASLIHYSAFEITQLKSMVADKIPLAFELLQAFRERAVDLKKIVEDHVYFEAFKGRSSIKVVLPALVPSLSYKDMQFSDGISAALGFRTMVDPDTSPEEVEMIRRGLLAYCCLDTLAMVEIYRALRNLA